MITSNPMACDIKMRVVLLSYCPTKYVSSTWLIKWDIERLEFWKIIKYHKSIHENVNNYYLYLFHKRGKKSEFGIRINLSAPVSVSEIIYYLSVILIILSYGLKCMWHVSSVPVCSIFKLGHYVMAAAPSIKRTGRHLRILLIHFKFNLVISNCGIEGYSCCNK